MSPLSQIPLSIALCGLSAPGPAGLGTREQIPWARATGFAAVHLNAAAAGIRPRDLDRSARRDLAAIVRREGLALSGADLWIPPEHLTAPAHMDRALAALAGTIDLIAELSGLVRGVTSPGSAARPVLSTTFPAAMGGDALTLLAEHADRAGVRLADHALPVRASVPAVEPALGIGIDPAAALTIQTDPTALALQLGARLASARLSDVSRTVGGGRVPPGSRSGKLDLMSYAVALATMEFDGPVVVDTRSLPQPEVAAAATLAAWQDASSLDRPRGAGSL